MGVTTIKNINPITIGETILPKKIPILNQILFSGFNILEFKRPKIRKINDVIKDQIFISPCFKSG